MMHVSISINSWFFVVFIYVFSAGLYIFLVRNV